MNSRSSGTRIANQFDPRGWGATRMGRRRIFFFSLSFLPFFFSLSLSLSLSNGARGHIRGGSWTKAVRNVAYFSSHRGVSISGETSTGSNIASLPTPPRRPTSLPLLQIARVFPREDCESVREENSSRRGVVEYPCVRV